MIYSRRRYPNPTIFWKNRTVSKYTPMYVMNYAPPANNVTNHPFNPSRQYPLKLRRNTLRVTMNPNSPYYNTHSRLNTTIKQLEIPNGYTMTTNANEPSCTPSSSVVESTKDIVVNPNSNACAVPEASSCLNSIFRTRNRRSINSQHVAPPTNSYTMKYRRLNQQPEDPQKVVRYNLNRSSSHRTYTLRNRCLLK